MSACARRWELIDPGPEDAAMDIGHSCIRPEGHGGPHRCTCGEELWMTQAELQALVDAECWSLYDGCRCELLRDHAGLHRCTDGHHAPRAWTTHDAELWMATVRANLREDPQ